MERIPHIHAIGNASFEKKEQFVTNIENAYDEQNFRFFKPEQREIIRQNEISKSELQLGLIGLANAESNRLMIEAGVSPYDIPSDNYHVVPASINPIFRKHENEAWTDRLNQAMVISDYWTKDPVMFGKVAFHETMHAKSYLSIQAYETEKTKFRVRRSGITTAPPPNRVEQRRLFEGLNEATIANTEKKFLPKLLASPLLQTEQAWFNSAEIQKITKERAAMYQVPEEEVVWLRKHVSHWCLVTYPYAPQRHVLDYICHKIQNSHPDQYETDEQVFNEFQNANFTGKLLTIARLVEETFGEGSFGRLGEMTRQPESGKEYLKIFKELGGEPPTI